MGLQAQPTFPAIKNWGSLGGTPLRALMTHAHRTKYYVKGTPGSGNISNERADNEVLAPKLITAADGGVAEMHLVNRVRYGRARRCGPTRHRQQAPTVRCSSE